MSRFNNDGLVGACEADLRVRVLLPLGEMTTTLEISPLRKETVLHQGRTAANIDDDRACRTKLAAKVKDIRKLFGE